MAGNTSIIFSPIVEKIAFQIPEEQKIIISFLAVFLLIALYSIFVWSYHKLLSRRNIIGLNLHDYDKDRFKTIEKGLAIFLYIIENLILTPILVVFWFSILAVFLLVLSKDQPVLQVMMISAAVVAATRFTSYISESISAEVAKLLPFILLGAYLITPNFFSFEELTNRILEIPLIFNHILIFLVIIVGMEIIMRVIYLLYNLVSGNEIIKEE